MQSFFALALCLSLAHTVSAHVSSNQAVTDVQSGSQQDTIFKRLFSRLLGKDVERRQSTDGVCYEDQYYDFVHNSSFGQTFCQAFYSYPNQTTVTEYTPTSTYTDISTTTSTYFTTVRQTPMSTVTVTVTPGMKARSDSQITASPVVPRDSSAAIVAEGLAMFRRQIANDNTSTNDTDLGTGFSSACSCQTYGGSTIVETYTDEPVVTTLNGFERDVVTVVTTRTARPRISTVYVTANASSSSVPSTFGTASGSSSVTLTTEAVTTITSTSSSSAAPTPTAPAYTCPDDNNTIVSQMIGSERYDYLVLCDFDLTDPLFYGALFYRTFSECVAACSMANNGFDSPVCQGASYFNAVNSNGYNCFLKTSANGTVPAVGVDSALLQRIAVGISPSNSAGTSTESAPFAGETPTQNPGQMSSSFSAMMGNSTSNIQMVTPAPQVPVSGMMVNAGTTYYSQQVINGSTYSSGTAYSTYVSGNGSWYSAYYTTYTVAWASSTIEYATSETGTSVANTTSTETHQQSGENGEYSTIQTTNQTTFDGSGSNVTVIQSNVTYAANGTEISSTATTMFYSYTSAASGSGNGSAIGGAASGTGASAYVTSTAVIVSSGGSAGGASGNGSGVVGAPSTSATTIINSYGSAFGSGFVASGAAGATGAPGSGAITPSASAVTIVNSYGSAYSSGYMISGNAGGTGGGSSMVASGAVATPTPVTSTTVIVASTGTAYSSGFVMSGVVSNTGGSSGTALSGTVPSSASYSNAGGSYSSGFPPFSNSGLPRGPGSESSTAPLATGPSPYGSPTPSLPPANTTVAPTGTVPSVTAPSAYPGFSNSGLPRGPGSESSSTPTGTAPAAYTTPSAGTVTPLPSVNTTAPASSGSPLPSSNVTITPVPTAPSGYPSFSNSGAPRGPGSESSSTPSGTVPSGYPSFTNSGAPRGPGSESSSAPPGTAPTGNSTSPPTSGIAPILIPPPFVTGPTTCANVTMGTITIFSTTTEYGCYSSCLPTAGGYGAPQAFGPPVFANPTTTA